MKKVWIHMGYPKCFSTSLQTVFFEKHPEIAYGGVGIGDHLSYANKDLEFVFESLLQHANKTFYNQHFTEAKKVIDDFISKSDNCTVFSLETLIFPFSSLDLETITERIHELFADYDIQIFLVIREQYSFLKSLYGEFIRMGYPEKFSTFIQWIWGYRDRNFWELLNYPGVLQILNNEFGEKNIHVEFFENIKKNPSVEINERVSKLLGISNRNLNIWNEYPSLKVEEQANLLQINQEFRRGMGENVLHPFLNHHSRVVLERLESGYTNEQVFENVLSKRLAMVKMNGIPQQPYEDFYKLSEITENILKKMQEEWGTSNNKLSSSLGELPEAFLS